MELHSNQENEENITKRKAILNFSYNNYYRPGLLDKLLVSSENN